MAATNSSVLALDVGNKRVGLAVASHAARLARPLTTLIRDEDFWNKLDAVIEKESIDHIVIGLPRNLSGEPTIQTEITRRFASELAKRYPHMATNLQDEALTSKAAEAELERGHKKYAKKDIDALAASYILSDWISDQQEHKK